MPDVRISIVRRENIFGLAPSAGAFVHGVEGFWTPWPIVAHTFMRELCASLLRGDRTGC